MRRSKYSYFFEINNEYVGYSYLSDSYVHFPIHKKERIDEILKFPDEIVTNSDANDYEELCYKKCLISDDFGEYNFLMRTHRKSIYKNDLLVLTIVPTMDCNCRCTYCYEFHSKNSMMSREVIENIKNYIARTIKSLHNLKIGWFGGEPLISMDIIKEVSEFCQDLCNTENVSFLNGMTTNGVLLNNKNAQILSSCNIHQLQITLDGSQNNHDKTRVTVGGKPTFDIIYNNIINYLNTDEKNKIALRIHISTNWKRDDIEGIIETLSLFDQKYRNRISAYPQVLFHACSEMWAKECSESPDSGRKRNGSDDISIELTNKICEVTVNLGFSSIYNSGRGLMATCENELENYWVIRPDGFLTKCTVAIEKERAVAKLTKNGIMLFPERFFKSQHKEFSTKLNENCQDCKFLPFCWQGCIYQHYQNPDIDDFIKTQCHKDKGNWMIKRQMNGIMRRYLEEKDEK